MDFCNSYSWSLQLVGLYPEFLDTPDGVSLEFHSHVASADFSYAGGPEAYLRLDQLAGHDDFLVTNLSLSCTEPNDLGFHVLVPANDKSYIYDWYDYLDDLEFATDKTIVENVVVSSAPTNWTDWLGNAVSGFFELRIGRTLVLGDLFAAIVGISVFVFFIKLFK